MRRSTDPVANYRFLLELGFLEAGAFSECTGLAAETKTFEYREGGRNSTVLKFPDLGNVSNVTLKRGVLADEAADTLFRWHEDVMNGTFDDEANPNLRPADPDEDIDNRIAIVLQDEAGNEVKRWRLVRAFPVKWVAPELKAMAGEVAVETLELACEGLELV
ncbi:MAG: phage tail protein [bacterium]|nr:phage tail protein [bacterium]